MNIIEWITLLIFISFLGFTFYYWKKTVKFPSSYTRELFISIILQNLSIFGAWFYFTFLNPNPYFQKLLSSFVVLSLYLIYDYHDEISVNDPKGLWKLFLVFLSALNIGLILADPKIGTLDTSNANPFIPIIMTLIGFVAYSRAYYFIFRQTDLQLDRSNQTVRFLRIFVVVVFFIFVFFVFLSFISADLFDNPLFGYVLLIFFSGILLIIYSFDPSRHLAFPQGILWLGIIGNSGDVIYSRTVSRSHDQKEFLLEINQKFNSSFNPINQLISEALSANLEINQISGEKYSIFSDFITGGRIVCLVEKSKKRVANYDYKRLLKLLIQYNGTPFSSIDEIIKDPERGSKFLDYLLIPGV